ncbi:hypothetical protein B0H13DRAFT_1867044 [Mycena leptocephala]|nr:hypothetical protein B0H13DRAFT_1867044 [Mycena leptocephala]
MGRWVTDSRIRPHTEQSCGEQQHPRITTAASRTLRASSPTLPASAKQKSYVPPSSPGYVHAHEIPVPIQQTRGAAPRLNTHERIPEGPRSAGWGSAKKKREESRAGGIRVRVTRRDVYMGREKQRVGCHWGEENGREKTHRTNAPVPPLHAPHHDPPAEEAHEEVGSVERERGEIQGTAAPPQRSHPDRTVKRIRIRMCIRFPSAVFADASPEDMSDFVVQYGNAIAKVPEGRYFAMSTGSLIIHVGDTELTAMIDSGSELNLAGKSVT